MAEGTYKLIKENSESTYDEKEVQAENGKVLGFDSGLNPVMVDPGTAAINHAHTFLSLTDTPAAYTGMAGKVAKVNIGENAIEFGDPGAGATTFLALTDTPAAYTGQAGKYPKVNAGETALEFDIPGAGDFATKALDNLASTAVNASIIPASDSAIDLGSSAKYWANLYVDTIYTPAINGGAAANDDIIIQGTTNATKTASFVLIQPNGGRVQMGIDTTADTLFNLTQNVPGNTAHQLFVENINTGGRATFGMNSGIYPNHDVGIVLLGKTITTNDYPSMLGAVNDGGKALIHWSGSDQTEVLLGTWTAIPIGFYTNKTVKMVITSDGLVGISTINPAHRLDLGEPVGGNSMFKAGGIELQSITIDNSFLTTNAYYSPVWKYRGNGYAGVIQFGLGHLYLNTAPSGVAGNTITWSDTLCLEGTWTKLGIGNITPVCRLDLGASSTSNSLFKAGTFEIQSYATNNGWLADNAYYNAGWKRRAAGYAMMTYYVNGSYHIRTASSGTAGSSITWTMFFRALADGTVGIGPMSTDSNTVITGAKLAILAGGNVGVGNVSPTAVLHLKAGTATASTAPLKFTSGTLLSSPEVGAFEFLTDNIHITISTGTARKGVVLDDGTRLTSGKIPIATTNGRLIDGQTPLAGTKVYYVSDSSGGAATRKLTFIDGILTSET